MISDAAMQFVLRYYWPGPRSSIAVVSSPLLN